MKSSLLCILFIAATSSPLLTTDLKTVDDFRAAAAKANAVLTIPDWEQTPEAVEASMKDAIAKANAALDQIGAQDLGKVTFKSTVVALDDATYQAGLAANKATIIKETNTNPAMRAAGENAVKAFQEWAVGIDYREDVYKAIKAFADTHPKLTGEDEKLLKETLRDYRRAGLELPPDQRREVEQLRKELSKLGTDFDTNVVKANAPVMFTKADLDGLPDSFFASPGIKTGDDVYTVMANVTWQFNTVEENAKSEATRKAALPHSRDPRQRHKCSCTQSNARAPQQDRAATRLQIVGRLPNGSQNGQDWRECGEVHQRFGRREPAEIRQRSGGITKTEGG